MGTPVDSKATCRPSDAVATVGEIVRRIEDERIRYVFVGERHDVGPVKRFVVDLANRLVEQGRDVGLYVEGFRADCAPGAAGCEDLAGQFNAEAFSHLVRESRAPVRGLDPPQRRDRARRMAGTIAAGEESVRLVLAGSSHVRGAWDPAAEAWLYGGALRYPDPGDLVEAFPPGEAITVVLEPAPSVEGVDGYRLRSDGCSADYRLRVPDRAGY